MMCFTYATDSCDAVVIILEINGDDGYGVNSKGGDCDDDICVVFACVCMHARNAYIFACVCIHARNAYIFVTCVKITYLRESPHTHTHTLSNSLARIHALRLLYSGPYHRNSTVFGIFAHEPRVVPIPVSFRYLFKLRSPPSANVVFCLHCTAERGQVCGIKCTWILFVRINLNP